MVHQSVYELVHSEDREELQRQLAWNSFLSPDLQNLPLQVNQLFLFIFAGFSQLFLF